ncbi:MAG: hypothetical protein FD122_3500 [Stygiobacter sp.]|nr:MAG: hypothetical protein FD122_3500 [Stygiobacter sp.]
MVKNNTSQKNWIFTDEEITQQFIESTQKAKQADATEARAEKASYDHNTGDVTIFLNNGCKFAFPSRFIEELQNASAEDIADIEVTPRGTALRWKKLDADYSVTGLITNIFGTKAWMASLGRQGGSVKSQAKALAARANGNKGGRPKASKEIRVQPRT